MQFYLNRRVISVFIMGIASGFPWVMIGSALTLWLQEAGVGRAEIGYAGLIFTVYAVNFLWSPLVDQLRFSLFGRLGSRRSWVVLCQLIIALGCFWISSLDPASNAKFVVLVGLLIALFSATQDIAVDAYRIDSFAQNESGYISAAAAMATAGWWTGYAGMGFVPLALSDMNWSWPALYQLMGLAALVVAALVVLLPEPAHQQKHSRLEALQQYQRMASAATTKLKLGLCLQLGLPLAICLWAVVGSPGMPAAVADHTAYVPVLILAVLLLSISVGLQLSRLSSLPQPPSLLQASGLDRTLAWMLTALVAPLREFFQRNGTRLALGLLLFIVLFKVGEAFLGRMSIVFYKEIGYSNTDIATYSKLLTWWTTILFALLAGWVNARLGLVKGLFISGCAMGATNLMFALIALVGPRIDLYVAAVVIDGFTSAWSTVAFVSFISLMCNHAFSATQYALMASLGNLGRTTVSSISGQVVDWLGGNWALFFTLTAVMVIPSLAILLRLGRRVTQLETDARNFR